MTSTAGGAPWRLTDAVDLAGSTSVPDLFLARFVLVLGGYAIGSKGFAYLGIPPLFIGEISLVAGIIAFLCAAGALAIFRSPVVWTLIGFMAWSALRTVPYIREYGMLALRDAALWGYGTFAVIIGGILIAKPTRLAFLLRTYRRFLPLLLVAIPVMWLATLLLGKLLGKDVPHWPGTDVPIVYAKATDFLVQLSGLAAFLCVGLGGASIAWLTSLLTVNVMLTGFKSRGGLLAFLCAFGIALVARPRSRTAWSMAVVTLTAIALLGITGIAIRFPGMDREVSFAQFAQHVTTTTGSGGRAGQDLENTKEWRLAWWAVIAEYTVFGEYFWKGKGYGVNLADDDGFQVAEDQSLRSPHSVHMTILARSGVPGLLAWLALQISWATAVARSFLRARREHQAQMSALFAFLLAFWLACLVNGSFDVYLEGPTGGIWFWTIFGMGIAAVEIHKAVEQARTAGETALAVDEGEE